MSLAVKAIPTSPPLVRAADRVLDVASAVLLAGGAGLFLFARRALRALADGSYAIPDGVTWVSRAELHDTQSKVGLWLTAVGVALALLAFARHTLGRGSGKRPERQVNW